MTQTRPFASRMLRGALPFGALAILVATLDRCMQIARREGHVSDELWSRHPPIISELGMHEPEHTTFGLGFTLLAVVMAIVFALRTRMLSIDSGVRASFALRWLNRGTVLFWVSSMAAMLVMAWIPDGESPTHFIAALVTFGTLALYELLHATIMLAQSRAVLGFWFIVCPIAALACVYAWISVPSVLAQYAAVGLQFAYFIPLSPTLSRS